MTESLVEEQSGTGDVGGVHGWDVAVSGAGESVACGESGRHVRTGGPLKAVFGLVALLVGAALVYACFCHWLVAVGVVGILVAFYLCLCLVADYAPEDRESHLMP